jgi:hypothetical protein
MRFTISNIKLQDAGGVLAPAMGYCVMNFG